MSKLLCVLLVVNFLHCVAAQDILANSHIKAARDFTTEPSDPLQVIREVLPELSSTIGDIIDSVVSESDVDIAKIVPAVLQGPEALRQFLNNDGGTAVQFVQDLMKNITEKTAETRQSIIKDFLLAGMQALSTEVGHDFLKSITKNVISAMSNERNPDMNILRIQSYSGSGNPGGPKGPGASHELIEEDANTIRPM